MPAMGTAPSRVLQEFREFILSAGFCPLKRPNLCQQKMDFYFLKKTIKSRGTRVQLLGVAGRCHVVSASTLACENSNHVTV